MKLLVILGLSLFMIGCEASATKPDRSNKHYIKCKVVGNAIYMGHDVIRCENKEVICYKTMSTSLQCKFKEEDNLDD